MSSGVETRTISADGGRELCVELAGDPEGKPILYHPGEPMSRRQDRFVPVQHGQWLAATVPGAQAEISNRDGHLTMIGRVGEIHDWLLQYF